MKVFDNYAATGSLYDRDYTEEIDAYGVRGHARSGYYRGDKWVNGYTVSDYKVPACQRSAKSTNFPRLVERCGEALILHERHDDRVRILRMPGGLDELPETLKKAAGAFKSKHDRELLLGILDAAKDAFKMQEAVAEAVAESELKEELKEAEIAAAKQNTEVQ